MRHKRAKMVGGRRLILPHILAKTDPLP